MTDLLLDSDTRSKVIDGLLLRLRENYVFPDVANAIEESIRARLSNGEYDSITTPAALCETLTAQMQEISHDKHLHLFFEEPQAQGNEQHEHERWNEMAMLHNYGFEKVERMPGNIGYLDFRFFYEPKFAAETAIAALNFLANTSALIIDLRQNHGGDPAMIALLFCIMRSRALVFSSKTYGNGFNL